MDANENKDVSSEEKPGSSHDNVKKPGTSHENAKKDKKRDHDCDSQSSESCWSMMELKIRDQKPPLPHAGTKKMRPEKKEKKRRKAGRVDKRRRRRGRVKRRPIMNLKTRAPSMSTEDSHRSDSPRPRCKYCGHRCCMQRSESRASRRYKKKSRAQRARKVSKKMLSECNQIGSRCTMLSPLFLNSNATPQELAEQTVYCEITPQMIHHSVQELTMRRESVPSNAILFHLQVVFQPEMWEECIFHEPMQRFIGNNALEVVDHYVFLGQVVQLGRSNFDKEVARRIQLGWAAFGKLRDVFSSNIPQCLRLESSTSTNYPVNPNIEEAANELADKLFIANLIGIVWSLPDDYWRLTTALEKANKLQERHVTLFWRMYADTMRPLDINRLPTSIGQSPTVASFREGLRRK
ncbi:hypothetical protein MSG28_001274 [Choristoneura fumiferana]|uniref:Uncharacterized protein n=1 Tax=Choristoneura fumiferana TaxID=7141 RepID=A0ACC0K4P6_CHOFU|nr:hypothetical protein MSG28_001274 [Choristoneura fumiferana]